LDELFRSYVKRVEIVLALHFSVKEHYFSPLNSISVASNQRYVSMSLTITHSQPFVTPSNAPSHRDECDDMSFSGGDTPFVLIYYSSPQYFYLRQ
jgi:hypothetical protein